MTLALLLLFPFAMALAASCDLVSMTIPNRVSASLVAGFLVLAPLAGLTAGAMGAHALTAALVLVLGFAFFAAGWMGGGDAKLMAATALWLGPTDMLMSYAVLASLSGGALTLLLLNARALVAPATGIGFVDHLLQPRTGIPYGIALGAAGLAVYPSSPFFEMAVERVAAGSLF